MELGVKAIDGLLTMGKGQRMGIFAGSGVGKSTLMGMIARNVKADINVIALVGERGRELVEFIERDLGPEGPGRRRWGCPGRRWCVPPTPAQPRSPACRRCSPLVEFIERDLGPEGLARSVVVVATSDQPAMMRSKAMASFRERTICPSTMPRTVSEMGSLVSSPSTSTV